MGKCIMILKNFLKNEAEAKKVIGKIQKSKKIDYQDKDALAVFIAFLKTRVPDFEKMTNEIADKGTKEINKRYCFSEEKAKEILNDYDKNRNNKEKISPESFFKFIQNEEYYLEMPREHSLRIMLLSSKDIANYLLQMNWNIVFAPRYSNFITCDNPFVLVPPKNLPEFRGCGLITKGAKKNIPLTNKICLVISDKGSDVIKVIGKRKFINMTNYYLAINCDRFLVSNKKRLLKAIVKKTKINKWKKENRIHVS